VLREAEELADMARAAGKPLSGELRMGVIPTIAPFLLPRLLPRCAPNGRTSSSTLREETSQAACDNLHRGQLDCVLLALPYGCGDVEARRAVRRPPVRRLPARAEPRAPPETRSAGAIDEDKLLLLEDGHCLKDHALAACNRPELRAEAAMLGTSLHTLVQMVDNGLGLTMVPEMAIEAGILEGTGVTPARSRPSMPIAASRSSGARAARARRSSGLARPTSCTQPLRHRAAEDQRAERDQLEGRLPLGERLTGTET
jgi:LysR family hydrogen peroxide-inducible transcriptional activator